MREEKRPGTPLRPHRRSPCAAPSSWLGEARPLPRAGTDIVASMVGAVRPVRPALSTRALPAVGLLAWPNWGRCRMTAALRRRLRCANGVSGCALQNPTLKGEGERGPRRARRRGWRRAAQGRGPRGAAPCSGPPGRLCSAPCRPPRALPPDRAVFHRSDLLPLILADAHAGLCPAVVGGPGRPALARSAAAYRRRHGDDVMEICAGEDGNIDAGRHRPTTQQHPSVTRAPRGDHARARRRRRAGGACVMRGLFAHRPCHPVVSASLARPLDASAPLLVWGVGGCITKGPAQVRPTALYSSRTSRAPQSGLFPTKKVTMVHTRKKGGWCKGKAKRSSKRIPTRTSWSTTSTHRGATAPSPANHLQR